MKTRGELRLIQQALANNWAITPKGAADALALVREVLGDPHAKSRESLRACSVAIQMSESDLLTDEDDDLLAMVQRIGQELENAARAK